MRIYLRQILWVFSVLMALTHTSMAFADEAGRFKKAQQPDISGVYHSQSHSPEGSPKLVVFNDGFYAIPYFGGIQIGTWQIDNATVRFQPDYVKERFAVYGRYDPKLRGSMRVFFSGFEQAETYIGLVTAGQSKPSLSRVFNADANCTSWPFVSMFPNTSAQTMIVQTHSNWDHEDQTPHTFEFAIDQNLNDFIVQHYPVDRENQPFEAKIQGGTLLFDRGGFLSQADKEALDKLSDEDQQFLRALKARVGIGLPNKLWFNSKYAEFVDDKEPMLYGEAERIDLTQYDHDTEMNAYVLKSAARASLPSSSSDDFRDAGTIYEYTRITQERPVDSVYKLQQERSLFHFECD